LQSSRRRWRSGDTRLQKILKTLDVRLNHLSCILGKGEHLKGLSKWVLYLDLSFSCTPWLASTGARVMEGEAESMLKGLSKCSWEMMRAFLVKKTINFWFG
jgi:hypothetical protein